MPPLTSKQRAEREIHLLEAQGFSQYEIGRRTGISRGQVFNVLRGRAGLSQKTAASVMENLRRDFRVAVLRDYGTVWTEPANKRQYSLIGSHWNAIQHARETGDWSALKKFRGKHVTVIDKGRKSRLKLIDDRDQAVVRRLEKQHQLEPDEVTRGGSQPSRKAKA